jgi:hypothetical protein
MKEERAMNVNYALDDGSLKAMVRDVLARTEAGRVGQSTYLKTLMAAVQVEVGGKPVEGQPRGKVKSITVDDAIAALGRAHGRFYSVVLSELGPELDAQERNSKSAFARSSAATIRAALRTGLNPLTVPLPALTKEALRLWTREHAGEKSPPDIKTAVRRARLLVRRLSAIIEPMGDEEKSVVIEAVQKDLEALSLVVEYVPADDFGSRTHIIQHKGGRTRDVMPRAQA